MEYTEFEILKIENLKKQFSTVIDNSINEILPYIKDVIKKRWLSGESVNGGDILDLETGEGYSSLKYKNLKILKNPNAGGKVDLTLTGALGDNINIKVNSNGDYEIYSDDVKYIEIGKKYGFEEFGLNNNEKTIVFNILEEQIIEKINNLNFL